MTTKKTKWDYFWDAMKGWEFKQWRGEPMEEVRYQAYKECLLKETNLKEVKK